MTDSTPRQELEMNAQKQAIQEVLDRIGLATDATQEEVEAALEGEWESIFHRADEIVRAHSVQFRGNLKSV